MLWGQKRKNDYTERKEGRDTYGVKTIWKKQSLRLICGVGGWEKLNTKDAMQRIMRNAINNIRRIYTYTRTGEDTHTKIKTETRHTPNELYNQNSLNAKDILQVYK